MMLTSLAEVTANSLSRSRSSSRVLEVSVAFSKFAEEAQSIGLAVNESKTKCLLSSIAKDSSLGESVEIDGYNFQVVNDFIYLGSSINSDNHQSGNQT